jgi:membrane protease YdiL (CAAX protease family)
MGHGSFAGGIASMTTPRVPDSRFRAYVQFVVALFYYFLARALAHRGALGLASEQWAPVVEQAMVVFLLLLGYAGVGFSLNGQMHPISAQGLLRRPGWLREAGLGLGIGWGVATVCAAVMAVSGGIAVRFSFRLSSWGWFLADAAFFALLALGEEIVFRGYAFQRFARAVGSAGAVLGFAALYAFLQALEPGASRAGTAVALVLSLVLSTAYLRTRALWVSWGINFGWKASRALIFGFAVSGATTFSPVVQGDPMGAFWLTGGGFGLDGSWLAFFVILAAIPVVYSVTRELDFKYNAPEIVAGGIPVDLDAAARVQHEAAMGSAEPAPPPLVQIAPVAALANSGPEPAFAPDGSEETVPDRAPGASHSISGNESE